MKRLQQLHDIRSIKSIHSIGARSIPKVQRSSHLELYALWREKDRLGKEMDALDKRRGAVERQLASVDLRLEKLQEEVRTTPKAKGPKVRPSSSVKAVAFQY